ncbi:unnamed protein product [Hydatigera taeniaeformis]|uniref:ANK_REP_REGION domain-containing protein n=1 Tax=Hydatigena taeniaeformis TaxID=6205 RepID=A0A0R3WRA3_HYDTA|nr:unnamed protein product [Hydatigera taeniaeformis]
MGPNAGNPLVLVVLQGSDGHYMSASTTGAKATWRKTALHRAATAGSMNCVYLLVQRAIPTDILDYNSNTPLTNTVFQPIDVINYLTFQSVALASEMMYFDGSVLVLITNTLLARVNLKQPRPV